MNKELNYFKAFLNNNYFKKNHILNHILNNLKNIHLLSDETLKAKVLTLEPIYTKLQVFLINLNILKKEAVSVILSYIVFLLLLIVPEEKIDKLSTILKEIMDDFMNEQSGGIEVEVDGKKVNIPIPEKFDWWKYANLLSIIINTSSIIILIFFRL
jgi:hypothetical protein